MVLRALCLVSILIYSNNLLALELKTSTLLIIPFQNEPTTARSKDSLNSKSKDPKKASTRQKIELKVELALTADEQEKGLMYRKSLAPGTGMLFVFANEQPRQFWMRNTLIPLSIAFIDEKKTIFQISDLNPVKTLIQTKYDRAESIRPAKYVLEVPQGWFLVNKIKAGSTIVWKEEQKIRKSF